MRAEPWMNKTPEQFREEQQRRSGKTRLVYDKERRTIVTVRTPWWQPSDRLKSLGFGVSIQPFFWRLGFVQPEWMAYSRLFAIGPLRFAWSWR